MMELTDRIKKALADTESSVDEFVGLFFAMSFEYEDNVGNFISDFEERIDAMTPNDPLESEETLMDALMAVAADIGFRTALAYRTRRLAQREK